MLQGLQELLGMMLGAFVSQTNKEGIDRMSYRTEHIRLC